MAQAKSFVVSRFTNPSGAVVYRVSGFLHGTRIRKNFASRLDAEAEVQALEIRKLQEAAAVRPALTRLNEDQLHEAEAAFRRLKDAPRSLLFYLDYALANYREPALQKPLAVAVDEYLAARRLDHQRTLLSMRQLRSIENELTVFKKHFPTSTVSEFTAAKLTPYLERGKGGLKTYNNRRGLLSTFFKFAFKKDWVVTNPVEKTPHHRINHRRGSAVTISAEKTRELMTYLETFEDGALVPHFALCLFAGIRPCIRYGEISRLQPESVRLDTMTIHIEPEVSKVRMKRLVTIHPNLAAWLRAYPLEKYPIIPVNVTNTRRRVFEKFGLTHDVLRHTFISMHVGKYRSLGEAALQAGNSEAIIRRHYLDLKTPQEAEQFFGILPTVRRAADSADSQPQHGAKEEAA
jgi:hypothetical protein